MQDWSMEGPEGNLSTLEIPKRTLQVLSWMLIFFVRREAGLRACGVPAAGSSVDPGWREDVSSDLVSELRGSSGAEVRACGAESAAAAEGVGAPRGRVLRRELSPGGPGRRALWSVRLSLSAWSYHRHVSSTLTMHCMDMCLHSLHDARGFVNSLTSV